MGPVADGVTSHRLLHWSKAKKFFFIETCSTFFIWDEGCLQTLGLDLMTPIALRFKEMLEELNSLSIEGFLSPLVLDVSLGDPLPKMDKSTIYSLRRFATVLLPLSSSNNQILAMISLRSPIQVLS